MLLSINESDGLSRRTLIAGLGASLVASKTANSQEILQGLLTASHKVSACLAYRVACSSNTISNDKYYDATKSKGYYYVVGYFTRSWSSDQGFFGGLLKDIGCSALAGVALSDAKKRDLYQQVYTASRIEYLYIFRGILDDFSLVSARVTTPGVVSSAEGEEKFDAWSHITSAIDVTDIGKMC